jgi:PKD domain/WD40-like Beta Propeller Repeat
MPGILKYILVSILISFRAISEVFCQAPLFVVKPMSFNSPVFSDIAPVLVKDGIIFCSDRRTSNLTGITTFNDERLYNIYFVARKDTSKWETPQPIKSDRDMVLYYGPLSLASDGKTIYFTSGILTGKAAKKKNVTNPRGIFIGELSGTTIKNVRPFEYNNPKYSVAQPSISKDGKYLFFVSDMPGGAGGSDIYYCELINNKWSKPVNLGSKVNSSSRENYPYMHSSGRLYFSSDRPGGMGGMDIYYTTLNMGKWEEPVRLPPEINSPSDDFAFVADESLQTGYFTSNRDRRIDNIFKFTSTIIRKIKCDTLQINNYCYEFYDENAIKFDTIPFRYQWDFGDGSMAEGVKADHCFKGPGNYSIRLDVVNLITKETKKNEKTIDLELKDVVQPYISSPEICTIGKQIKLSADSTNLPGWNIKQYYWNFGDETVAIGKAVDKTYTKQGNYYIQLIVTSVPDAAGVSKEACVSKNINVIH